MKHSVAPLSSRAFVSASCSRVYSEMGTLIDRFQAKYTEFVLQARVRAVALRPLENPLWVRLP
jgi:hypothetical protein